MNTLRDDSSPAPSAPAASRSPSSRRHSSLSPHATTRSDEIKFIERNQDNRTSTSATHVTRSVIFDPKSTVKRQSPTSRNRQFSAPFQDGGIRGFEFTRRTFRGQESSDISATSPTALCLSTNLNSPRRQVFQLHFRPPIRRRG